MLVVSAKTLVEILENSIEFDLQSLRECVQSLDSNLPGSPFKIRDVNLVHPGMLSEVNLAPTFGFS